MEYEIRKMSGEVAPVWHMVIMPDSDYIEYCCRIAYYTHKWPRKSMELLKKFLSDGYLPIMNREDYGFIFEELEIPSDKLGIISKFAAVRFGHCK